MAINNNTGTQLSSSTYIVAKLRGDDRDKKYNLRVVAPINCNHGDTGDTDVDGTVCETAECLNKLVPGLPPDVAAHRLWTAHRLATTSATRPRPC